MSRGSGLSIDATTVRSCRADARARKRPMTKRVLQEDCRAEDVREGAEKSGIQVRGPSWAFITFFCASQAG